MYQRRGKRPGDAQDTIDLADKHQKFVEKMQNPDGREDEVDGNVLGSSRAAPLNHSFSLDELPDGSHISPIKVTPKKDRKSIKQVEYIGSFCVTGDDQNQRAEYVKSKLVEMREVQKTKTVLLVISLSGIKVCCSSGESVYMAHALKRISYATCDPQFCQFSFLAREPKSDTRIQYCHAFVTKSSEEAEELNTIIGNAFKMAFAYQKEERENQKPAATAFHQLIEAQITQKQRTKEALAAEKQEQLQNRLSLISTPTVDEQMKERKETRKKQQEELDRKREEERMRGKERIAWAKNIVGRTKHKSPFSGNTVYPRTPEHSTTSSPRHANNKHGPRSSTPPTPPMFKHLLELRDLLNSPETRSYGSPVMTLKETIDSRFQNGTLLGLFSDPAAMDSADDVSGSNDTLTNGTNHTNMSTRPLPATPGSPTPDSGRRHSEPFQHQLTLAPDTTDSPSPGLSSPDGSGDPPTLKEKKMPGRQQSCPSMNTELSVANNADAQRAPWYQKGIEREVALEYLSQQETGSFIVRDSSTHKGCFALSIKVPKYENPSGISHYLILKTHNGNVKLKGVDREWPDLLSLVTHHSVSREVLPCTLKFPTDANNPMFRDAAEDNQQEEEEEDDDYNNFSDCSVMMNSLKV